MRHPALAARPPAAKPSVWAGQNSLETAYVQHDQPKLCSFERSGAALPVNCKPEPGQMQISWTLFRGLPRCESRHPLGSWWWARGLAKQVLMNLIMVSMWKDPACGWPAANSPDDVIQNGLEPLWLFGNKEVSRKRCLLSLTYLYNRYRLFLLQVST